MTTVVADFRTKSMASDSMISHQGTRFQSDKIFHEKNNKALVGIAGEVETCYKIVDWYFKGADKNSKPEFEESEKLNAEVLIMEENGLYIMGTSLRKMKVKNDFYALGSGSIPALAAMHMGADVKKAVEIAIMLDPSSNGPVEIKKLGETNEEVPTTWPLPLAGKPVAKRAKRKTKGD